MGHETWSTGKELVGWFAFYHLIGSALYSACLILCTIRAIALTKMRSRTRESKTV